MHSLLKPVAYLRQVLNLVSRRMKVLVFNASPRKARGTTDVLLEAFIDGAKAGNAEVEKHHIVDLDINGCLSCFSCWWKTPGKCVHRDDMDWILPKIAEADILVFGSPIYGRNVTHYMQRLVERTFSFTLPEMNTKEGETSHPTRLRRFPQIVLAATCGFPDLANFDIVRALNPTALHILLPASQIMFYNETKEYISDFLEAIRHAAKKMVEGEEITKSVRDSLIMEYPDEMKAKLLNMHNLYSASQLE